MATVTSLGFSIVSRWVNRGVQNASRDLGQFENRVNQIGERVRDGLGKFDEQMGKVGLAAGAALGAGLVKAVDTSAAQAKLAAQLGLTAQESQRLGKVAGKLYSQAYGESLEEVNNAVAAVVSSIDGMRNASNGAVQDMTAKVLSLSRAFEIDVGRSAQVVGQLVKSGLVKNATEGLDLLTATLQKVPAAVREDIIDALDEYSPFLNQIGLKGQQAFELLAQGAAKGMYGIDKTGDALKEFTIRATDMSTATQTAYDTLGLNTEKVTRDLLAGGQRGATAFQLIITKLRQIKDPAKQSQTALALFGTPMEDLSTGEIPKFLQSLDTTQHTLGNTAGAASRLGDTLQGSTAAKIETFKRSIEQGLTQAAVGAIPTLENLAAKARDLGVTPAGIGRTAIALTGLAIAAKGASIAVGILTATVRGHSVASVTAATAVRGYAAAINLMTGWRNINAAMATNATLMTRLGAAMKSQILLWRQMAAAQGISTTRLLINAAAQRVVAAATLVWAAAQAVLNGAMTAITSPIGLVIIGIVALVAAIVIAYKKSETFRNIVNGVWNAIKTGVVVAINFVRDHWKLIGTILLGPLGPAFFIISTFWRQIWGAALTAWNILKPILMTIAGFLTGVFRVAWIIVQNAIKIVWIAIQLYIKVAWTLIKGYFNLMKFYVTQILAPIFQWLYRTIIKPVWNGIVSAIKVAWSIIKGVWNVIRSFLAKTLGPQFTVFKRVASNAWSGLKVVISNVVGGIKTVWNGLKSALSTVQHGFQVAVSAIKKHWNGLKSATKTPVNFVIGVYNKGIVDLVNKVASFAGIKTRLGKIPLLAAGGSLDNPLAAQPMMTNGPMAIVGEGRKQYPEFVIPTDPAHRRRAQALWAMAGQHFGTVPDRKWLVGRKALGGEGIAFARGGSLQALGIGGVIGGFIKGLKDWTLNAPEKALKGVLGKVLGGALPGSGVFRDVVAAIPGWIKDQILGWFKKKASGMGGGPGIQRALAFARAQVGKPYIWGGVGPGGYDCSGFMSALTNVIQGRNPYSRRFTTFSFTGSKNGPAGFQRNLRSGFTVGVTNAGVGHMAGTLAGVNVESSGSRGVHMGPSARGTSNSLFGMRYGLRADTGALTLAPGWNPPTYNGTGRMEYLETPRHRPDEAKAPVRREGPLVSIGEVVVKEKADVDMVASTLGFAARAVSFS